MTGNSKTDIAAKIARILEAESPADLSSLVANIEKISDRLDRIEAKLETADSIRRPTFIPHPSQDRFAVVEAIADEIFSNFQKEKACTFEPNGKPCDHCSMCSSRGF